MLITNNYHGSWAVNAVCQSMLIFSLAVYYRVLHRPTCTGNHIGLTVNYQYQRQYTCGRHHSQPLSCRMTVSVCRTSFYCTYPPVHDEQCIHCFFLFQLGCKAVDLLMGMPEWKGGTLLLLFCLSHLLSSTSAGMYICWAFL